MKYVPNEIKIKLILIKAHQSSWRRNKQLHNKTQQDNHCGTEKVEMLAFNGTLLLIFL